MIKDQFDLFAGHQEVIQLFQKLSERRAGRPWSFLPILSLVGPVGYGKSEFINHLYFLYCNAPLLPHISLDFGKPKAPHDLLNILGTLRQSLRHQRDEHGRALAFPRFDIVYSRLKRSEGLTDEERGETEELFGEFGDLIGLAGNIHVALGFLLFILKFVARIPPLHALLRWLVERAYQRAGGRPQWRWYQDQVNKFKEFNLTGSDDVSKMRRRLNEMCTMGEPERQFLINQILPKAFLADLRYGVSANESSMLKNGPPYVVIFLDSFEVLLRNAEPVARQLLEILALNEYRKRGDNDPLLLIVASEERLPDMSRQQLNRHFLPDADTGGKTVQERANALYEDWRGQLPPQGKQSTLRLRDVYLPLPLPALTLDTTRDYLLKLDQHNETNIFTNEALIEDIYRLTQGYPIFLEYVAKALQASMQRPGSSIENLEDLFTAEHGEQVEQIVDRLLARHCKQVEERLFMLSAMPRTLTPDLLRLVLQRLHSTPPDDNELEREWQRYRHLPFLLASGDKKQHITFVPGIRALFLKKLQIAPAGPDSDYINMHQLLFEYFAGRIQERLQKKGTREKQDLLERSYHELALGRYQSVIQLATYAQQYEPDLWEDLLKIIAQAPMHMPSLDEVEQQAFQGLYQVQQQTETAIVVLEAIRAIVLYTWLLAHPGSERKNISSLWYNLGKVYRRLQNVDPRVRSDAAAFCYRRADELLNSPAYLAGSPARSIATRPLSLRRPGARQFLQSIYRSLPSLLTNRRTQIILSIVLLSAVLLSLFVPRFVSGHSNASNIVNSFLLPPAELKPGASNRWIGATVEPGGEFVGLSDGSLPFDYLRPDGSLKIQAAQQLYQGDIQLRRGDIARARIPLQKARTSLQQAVALDSNDAEAQIYLQDIQVYLLGKSCAATFVVATRIIEDTGDGVNNGRDNLQGASIVQKDYNTAHQETPICLYIANLGTNPGYELSVAQQLVSAAAASKGAIQGLIGWPGLLDSPTSLAAIHLLEKAQLPLVSPESYDEVQFVSNVFHIAPSRQDQGSRAALYAEQVLQKKRALIITDPADPYGRDLTEGFEQRFKEDGNQIVALQTYTTGQTAASTLAAELHKNIFDAHPDFMYFTGGTEEGSVLLADSSPLPLLGSEQLYSLLGFSPNTRPGFDRLAFTSAAYADAPVTLQMKALYALDFDPQDPQSVREYGYSRPDSEAILSYDAMVTLITAYTNAQAGSQSVQQVLSSSIRIEGASRPFLSFTPLHELEDQRLFVLAVNQQEEIRFFML